MKNNIKKIDIKALQFRDELIKLCQRYNCEITGDCLDSINMTLKITDKEEKWTSCYAMESYNSYNLTQDDETYESEYLMDKVIRKIFDRESYEPLGLFDKKWHYAIITNDRNKALIKLNKLKNKYKNKIKYEINNYSGNLELYLKDGRRFIWVRPILNNKGHKCHKAIIDRNITLEELEDVIAYNVCSNCGRSDIEIF